MTSIDDRLAALHLRMDRADEACSEGEAQFWRFEIHRLEDERDNETRRAHRRQLERDLARCLHGGDVDGAEVVRAQIAHHERGQLS